MDFAHHDIVGYHQFNNDPHKPWTLRYNPARLITDRNFDGARVELEADKLARAKKIGVRIDKISEEVRDYKLHLDLQQKANKKHHEDRARALAPKTDPQKKKEHDAAFDNYVQGAQEKAGFRHRHGEVEES